MSLSTPLNDITTGKLDEKEVTNGNASGKGFKVGVGKGGMQRDGI